ncbi:RNA polymerase sigma factor [Arthrobacter sp. R4-81]
MAGFFRSGTGNGVGADDPDNEALLLKGLVKRDENAFAEVYDRYADGVLRYLVKMTGSIPAAEELAQETFFLLWEKAKTVSLVNGSLRPWIFSTAKFLSYNHNRKHGNQPTADIDELDASKALVAVSAESIVVTNDQISQVMAVVATMSVQDQAVFRMFFLGDVPHAQIAAATGITTAAVKNRVLRMRSKLKELFNETQGEEVTQKWRI